MVRKILLLLCSIVCADALSDPCLRRRSEKRCLKEVGCVWDQTYEVCELNRCNGTQSFSVSFTGNWTEDRHPIEYPSNAHFSALIGASFGYGDEFWRKKGISTEGMKDMAEFGGTFTLTSELEDNEAYLDVATSGSGTSNTGDMALTLEVDATRDQVGFVSMIAPSPDWFIGVSAVELCDYETGQWKSNITLPMFAYDAGTDKGKLFDSDDKPNKNHKKIKKIKCGKVFCKKKKGFVPLGYTEVVRLSE
mmetsp:Transcript_10732/g.14011  ORF Transcript_10732/g.14011 Transcript_10732/m.14011 type:complete len:249 (+) Transcript_10732:145-891(+)